MLNIVLVAPEIPQNSGNIGRLCVNTESRLHLIRPLGFALDAASIRRAGLDYWPHLCYEVYADWADFLARSLPQRMIFLSTKAEKSVYDWRFQENDFMVFGNESSGLPAELYSNYREQLMTIPMPGRYARSLNLANSVAVAVFEALRQLNDWGLHNAGDC